MKETDCMREKHRIMKEMRHRIEVENKAFELVAQGKFNDAREIIETLDNSLLEFRKWPGEEESEIQETNVLFYSRYWGSAFSTKLSIRIKK